MPPDILTALPDQTRHLPRFRRAPREERPAFRLTSRDREALKIIYEHRYITAEKLQDLISPVKLTERQQAALGKLRATKKANVSGPRQRIKRGIRRRLQFLYHHGYVQRHKLSDGEQIAYALGNLGADELMLTYGIDRKEIEWTTKNRECSERYIRHALMVTSLRHAVEVAVRDVPQLHLAFWEPDGAFQATVPYKDTVHTRDGVRTHVVEGTVKPDSLFVIADPANRIHYFPEADRSTMTRSRYLAKLKVYYAFWATYVKGGRSSRIKQMRVLTITRSEERKQHLREIADEVSPEAKNLFWFICEKAYLGKPQEILKDTWQTLEDDTLKRLYDHG